MSLVSKIMVAGALVAATSAFAGPPVTVTFKNQGTANANLTIINSNESTTYAIATPTPLLSVKPGTSNTYLVQNPISPDANYASVRYRIGSKECAFLTTYVLMYKNGAYVPTWNKSATASGGAICTATITSVNYYSYAWTVDFIMK